MNTLNSLSNKSGAKQFPHSQGLRSEDISHNVQQCEFRAAAA